MPLSKPPSSAGATGAWQYQTSGPLAVNMVVSAVIIWYMVTFTSLSAGVQAPHARHKWTLQADVFAQFGASAETCLWGR